MTRFGLRKNYVPLFIILLGLTVGLAACKLTTNGGGTAPPPPSGNAEYLFATSNNQVWSFNVNATTGALSGGAAIAGPGLSQGIVGNPAGTFLYVSDTVNDQVHVYSISSSGTLSEIGGSPYTVGTPAVSTNSAAGLAMDSGGKFLYAADALNNDVAGFTVNSSTGALTAATSSPFATATTPTQIAVDASNSFAYVPDFNSIVGGVSAFTLNNTTGALTAVPGFSPFNTVGGGGPLGVATKGQYVYVTEQTTGGIAALTINSTTGGLSPVLGSPFATGSNPTGVAISPSGKFLYVANNGDSTISAYSVNSTSGILTPIGSPVATTQPWYLTIDPSGSFLYATNPASNTISGFTINTSIGALTQFSGAATAVGTQPVSLTAVTVP